MKRLISIVAIGALCALASPAVAGDWHNGANLICSDCHLMHGSQEHGYGAGGVGTFTAVGADAPYDYLLRNEINELCLTCHDGQTFAPDVFGDNGGVAMNRNAGGLTAAAGHRANAVGYEESDGHTLWATDAAPGGTFTNAEGLHCTDCHAQHGNQPAQYRNLRTSTSATNIFNGKPLTYATGANDGTKDVYQRVLRGYSEADVDYNEPVTTASAYGNWCSACHVSYHGSGGSANMGGTSGGSGTTGTPWLRHPTADVNVGWNASTPHVSSLSQFNSHTNRVKVMDSQGLWNGTATDNTITPSCFSCHKSHGNKNAFGLIFMSGTGTRTEEGDDGTRYNDLCRQCHIQGA